MGNKYFLVQIKHTSNAWEKGVVVKDTAEEARQSYFAYLGAYGYGKDANTDYVQVSIFDAYGNVIEPIKIDDRRTTQAEVVES